MFDRVRRQLSYANVMSTIAVFAALGGGAYAAATIGAKDIKRNAVRAKHIKKNQIASRHLKKGAVTNAKIAAGAITTGKLRDGAVTGAKVDEATLAVVPNADRLDGLDSLDFVRGAGRVHGGRLNDTPGGQPASIALDVGGELTLTCNNPASAPSTFAFVNSSGAPADVWTEKFQGPSLPFPYAVAYSSVANGGNAQVSISGPVVSGGDSIARFTIAIGAKVTKIDAKLVFAGGECRAATLISELRG
jgi:hypothetical protein